ncbi:MULTISPECIES: acyl-CoA thioesterase [unclassified Marinovum]|uniref:acyl-CoA thioesterase n=1 Tax=unclassified Marinovum TaxID=2647166 RepID=UPI003EDC452C
MAFEIAQKVLFRHCDPAGIVFFPRYFEMMNDCVEAFFDETLGWPFAEVHKTAAVPTAEIRTRFQRPSFHGDRLTLRLVITHVGRTSLGYDMRAICGEELRFATEAVLVHVDGAGKPAPWPEEIRQTLLPLKEANHDT